MIHPFTLGNLKDLMDVWPDCDSGLLSNAHSLLSEQAKEAIS